MIMANTCSWKFPDMFNVAQNKINLVVDEASVVNRTRLLLLTEPGELYNEPDFGVGLKRYIWQYNNSNTRAIMKDRIREQIRIDKNEPCVEADEISFEDSLTAHEETDKISANELHLTVNLPVTFGGTANIPLDDELARWYSESEYTNTDEIALRDE